MADDGSLQERILKTLENIIVRDPELLSFSIVPEEENTKNKSPILYEHHHLALESWCVKHIYKYAYASLLEVRSQLRRNRLPSFRAKNLNHLLVGVLLINPDVSSFWAMKRELVECDILGIENELLFSKLVLSYKSKSNETFSYRRWLLKRLLDKANDQEVSRLIHLSEMIVVDMAAEKSANNYHAWTHRIWCAENILCKITPHITRIALYHRELGQSIKWIEQHVSENTGYHYRQYLFKIFKSESQNFYFGYNLFDVIKYLGLINHNDPVNFLIYLLGKPKNCIMTTQENNGWLNYFTLLLHEMFFDVVKLNTIFPGHESLWYHRRFLVYHLVQGFHEYHNIKESCDGNTHSNLNHIANKNIVDIDISCLGNTGMSDCGEKQPKIFKSQPVGIESSRLYELLCKSEQKFISDNSTGHLMQMEYARRHAKWLKLILGFQAIC